MRAPGRLVCAATALGIAALLGACGNDDDAEPSGAADASTTAPTSGAPADVAPPAPVAEVVELDADVPSRVEVGPITWSIEATNVSDGPVVITFPTTQTGDVVLRDRSDAVVHRSSDGQFFAQQLQSVTLAPGETMVFDVGDDLSGIEPGSYELSLELTAVGPPEPFTARIRLVDPGS